MPVQAAGLQANHCPPALSDDEKIERVVHRTLEHLATRPIPVRARLLRADAAGRYLGVDDDYLRVDRAEARRSGARPKFAFRKLGTRIVYDLKDLDAGIDRLTRVAGQADLAAAA